MKPKMKSKVKLSVNADKSALEKARSQLKKAEHANTPLSIKKKLTKKPRKKK